MKRLLLFLLAAPVLWACGGEDVPEVKPDKGSIRPFELVRIEADKGVKIRATSEDGLLTALEIAKRGHVIVGVGYDPYTDIVDDKIVWKWRYRPSLGRRFGKSQRDTISDNPALLMQSEDILDENTSHPALSGLKRGFIHGYNWVILDEKRDTIAYVPNAVLRKAEEEITKAYADKNYNEVYRLFHEAFKFRPITGKMWRELRKDSLQ